MRKIINRILARLTFKSYREQLLLDNRRQLEKLNQIHEQVFLNNPILIVQQVKMFLPLFYIDHIQKTIYQQRNFYEHATLEFLRIHYRTFNHIIDIGSNIGNHMLYYCSYFQPVKVYCFEPNQVNLDILKKNIAINRFDQVVEIYPCALGAESGKGVQENFTLRNTGMNSVRAIKEVNGSADVVSIRTLDSFAIQNVDLIKIDVEGGELDVLRGAEETIRRCKPVILMEVFEENACKINELMKNHGYQRLITLDLYNNLYVSC